MALKRVWIGSPNCSSRGGSGVRLIVLHTAEGARTYQSLGSFFSSSSSGVSSHTGIDDTKGTIGEYVSRGNKAWTQGNFNPVCVSVELCGFAAWSTAEWKNNHHNMLENCAAWIAEEAAHFGLPVTRLSPSQAQGSGRGVCQHVDLGAAGGGHSDCGAGFPMDYVLDMAKGGSPAPPKPKPPDVKDTVAVTSMEDGRLEVFAEEADGHIWHRWNAQGGGWSEWASMGTPGK